MGMINLSYFRDSDKDKLGNIFKESYDQSHHATSGYLTFNPIAESKAIEGDRCGKRLKAQFEAGSISGYLSAARPHHSSQRGIMILTTDYMIDLCLEKLPNSVESFDDAVRSLTAIYRKNLMRYRHHIGRDHPMVTKKKLLAEKPELIVSHGSKDAVPRQNLGHFVAMNFDCLDVDEDMERFNAAKDISDTYHSLVESPESSAPDPICLMQNGPLGKYQSLHHWVSLTEADVVIIEYNHFLPTAVFSGHREARTPAETLMGNLNALPDRTVSESIYLKEYLLMKEFFASQGYEINL